MPSTGSWLSSVSSTPVVYASTLRQRGARCPRVFGTFGPVGGAVGSVLSELEKWAAPRDEFDAVA
jgi:hypothetical protein